MMKSFNFLVFSKFLLPTQAQTTEYHQIKTTIFNGQDLCLTFQASKTMAAYDPSTGIQGGYEIATWEACDVTETIENQLFTSNSFGQVKVKQIYQFLETDPVTGVTTTVAKEKCLSPLPLPSFHPNLNHCDTWFGFDGAATYLFVMDCENNPNEYQRFVFNEEDQVLKSSCSHQFKLGSVADNNGDFKAFLTNETETFPSAIISNDLNLQSWFPTELTPTKLPIPYKKKRAVQEILEEFLPAVDLTKLENHGCWCSRILGVNPDFRGEAVDDLDRLCKQWSVTRRCNRLKGGSCYHTPDEYTTNPFNKEVYTLLSSGNSEDFTSYTCNTAENLAESCFLDSCHIDLKYALLISGEIENLGSGWNFEASTAEQCSRQQVTLDDLSNSVSENEDLSSLGDNFENQCVGVAPDLQIIQVEKSS